MYSGIGLVLGGLLFACVGPGLEPPGSGSDSNATVQAPGGVHATRNPGQTGSGGQSAPMTSSDGNAMHSGSPAGAAGSDATPGAPNGGNAQGPTAGSGGSGPGTGVMSPSTNCQLVRYPAPLGLHLLVDDSFAMVVPTNIWTPLGAALSTWSVSDTMANTQLASQLFAGECNADAYSNTALPIASAAQQQAALDAQMNASTHGFGAATGVALNVVSDRARAWTESAQGNAAVVLITASEPSACDADAPGAAASAAGMALALPQAVPTYVLALRSLPSLDAIAAAGGTNAARSVDDATSSAALADAMGAIADDARCRYALPSAAQALAPDQVNLDLVSSTSTERLTRVADASACGDGQGWYYDDAQTRRFAIVCPATCSDVRGGDSIEILYGCQ